MNWAHQTIQEYEKYSTDIFTAYQVLYIGVDEDEEPEGNGGT